MAIKCKIGKLHLTMPFKDFILAHTEAASLAILPLEMEHVFHLDSLALLHRDPFDRVLAAQCLSEGIPIVSVDAVFDSYGLKRTW
jgi:PIN domain nuclease of toxin-antitoxin system